MMWCSRLVLFYLAVLLALSKGATVYMISPSNSIASCQPVAKCFTLSQFAANSKAYFKQNTTLIFQPGIHSLESEFKISDINHLSMRSLLQGTANIVCTETGKMTLTGVNNAQIKDIIFIRCAENKFSNVKNLELTQLVFSGPSLKTSGTALEVNNTNAFISQCSFSAYLYGSIQRINSKIQHSFSFRDTVVWSGGALIVIGSNVTVYKSAFEGNRAQLGGAVYTTNSNVTIISSEFEFNTANSSHSSVPASGGAIFAVNAIILVYNTTIMKSNVYYGITKGGAISIVDSRLTLSHSLLKDNTAIDIGGAVHAISSDVTVMQSSCYRNKASIGGTFAVNASKLTIINTMIWKSRVNTNGGAVLATGSVVVVRSSLIKHSFAEVGSVFYSTSSMIMFYQSTLSQNIAIKDGGIIYCTDSCRILAEESDFHSNSVEQRGGVVRVGKISVVISKYCRFTNNTATNGGVISAGPSNNIINMTSTVFQDNVAYSSGGVVSTFESSVYISNCSFTNNRAFIGGVIASESKSSLVCKSCLFSSNSAHGGGVMNIEQSIASLDNVSIVSNFATRGVVSLKRSNVTLSDVTVFQNNNGSFIASNSSLSFYGNTLFKNNYASSSSTPHYGGALTLINSSLLLGGPLLTIVNNSAQDGGAVNANMSTITNTGKLLALGNVARSSGGAMFLFNCDLQCAGKMTFNGNIALKRGGAIDSLNSSIALNSNCSLSFKDNFAAAGDDIIMDSN